MMDRLTIEAAEAAVHAGYPEGANARAARRAGRRPVPRWRRTSPRSRRSAASAAPARSAPPPTTPSARCCGRAASRRSRRWAASRASYYVQDGVVPRTKLPEVLRRDRGARGRVRPARRQRLPRRRRQPPSARALRRRASRASRSGRARWPRRSSRRASTPAARSPASTAIGVDKACSMPLLFSEPTISRRCSGCGGRSTRPDSATRARSSRPRGCAARCPGRTAQHPLERQGLPSVSEIASVEDAAEVLAGAAGRGERVSIGREGGDVVISTAGSTGCSSTRPAI